MAYPYQLKTYADYQQAYRQSIENPSAFWLDISRHFYWHNNPQAAEEVVNWNFDDPSVQWFAGCRLNLTENLLDRHLEDRGEQTALIWEPNDPEAATKKYTYRELHEAVCRFTRVLRRHGLKKGDRVCLYMGMVPELAIAVLACARMGAVHSVVFGGFSAQSIADRIQDAGARMVITQDGGMRGNKETALKSIVDEALLTCPGVNTVIVLEHSGSPVNMQKGRDYWWANEWAQAGSGPEPAESMDAEDPLFILYTSGSTGKPKGVVHTQAGYLIWTTYTFVNIFQYRPGEIHFCTADIGWITGHSYVLYGPLSAGGTTLLFEGIPTWPDAGRFWDIIDKHQVNILYTAPTAIRSLMAFGDDPLKKSSRTSLRVLGSVGEPINEEAWQWYHDKVGNGRCAIVDTWWQTETGGCMISNLAGVTPHKPAYATLPLPGVRPLLMDEQGNIIPGSEAAGNINPSETIKGNLCISYPWPGILRTTWGDHVRCRENYFSAYPGMYFTGDGCLRDTDGFYRITGRVDDVLNVSGHRIGTAEVENAINQYSDVVESAVVGYPHDIKGQGIYAFVILQQTAVEHEHSRQDILQTVSRIIGPLAKPDKIQFVRGLPKTRSGKIMRRILRKIAANETEQLGDTSTLLDPAVVQDILAGRL